MDGMKRLCFRIGLLMLILAILFFIYALNNPQASFPWSNSITYGIYISYAVAMFFLLIYGLRGK
ncbi:hypothetical protein CLNEO_15640 [Anaerotignum neopropionicum]|uniref:Uncharacterized protein n=1 Tax=Anaerotignum neopropionicum TaxID=36847 RepID=A0A136WEV8_9FIRM|nr:hypothetical protein [Anaerotignum neopropionicum]KXL53021.1 hypothetical protein CLNEO_15640 [Anaerotignum neopropionicum]